ncbi:VOC family protein [Bacillus horti]|uniref:Catechol 2,3-dioxygenase-like lactoylglutathione lyase family enzyme n=1 Tax=Caldalkalibacillus horti TaxID=77523 RepID=A0ABT9W0G7_9BACI|nr:VOC family protein [Bacillus horti]MDQ0166728.1 catechol 2,3-dioxygenase-like lactoylglutathione lyase family enzyme [Bacillus horti]
MAAILNQVGTIFIPVSDIERARDWYCKILQLPIDREILHGHLYVLPMNGTGIVLDSKIYAEEHVFKAPLFHFNTNNVKEAYEYMKSKDVKLLTEIEHDHWFNFQDPDGNVMMVCHC